MHKTKHLLLALSLLGPAACNRTASAAGPARKPLLCKDAPKKHSAAPGNPEARHAAQRGLAYLARASEQWTDTHKCFGCHVQGVTMEALAVGKHHQYDVPRTDLDAIRAALELGPTAGGHTTGVAFEGQAWARYDQFVDGQHGTTLLKYASDLLALQREDGSVPDDDARLPVTGGTMHTTYQAMQTWRQTYARTADDKWLTPMRKAEKFLAAQSANWNSQNEPYIQDVNLALLGLVAANVGPSEASSMRLQRMLLARQNQDGGWGLDKSKSDALATGQTLYALKLAGHGDAESGIARATAWLVKHQDQDGAWRTVRSGQGGAEKGEGMWAVLGLVSVDVMSVSIDGLSDGQHVDGTVKLAIEARDNQAGGVAKVEVFVDDLPLGGECAPKVALDWDTKSLTEGKHTVDVVATNTRGQESRRRLEVWSGNNYLTEIGTRFDDARQATDVTVRNIAPTPEQAGKVELDVYTVEGNDNKQGKKVWSEEQKGAPGAMTFSWKGQSTDGKAQPRGRYLAELVMRDAKGKVIQRKTELFFHDSEQVQKQKYGEIEGQLSLQGGAGVAANSDVELLDDKGNVVQRVQSNEQGNYRFKNVSAGNYKVRAHKRGWTSQEAPAAAAPSTTPAKADFKF